MKIKKTKILILFCACFLNQTATAQIEILQFINILNPSWKVSSNVGFSFQGIPTTINIYNNVRYGSPTESKYKSTTQLTAGIIGGLTICPLKTDYFAYEFVPTISMHWAGNQTGSTRIFSNQILGGFGRVWGVLGKQNAFKDVYLNHFDQVDSAQGIKYQSQSKYYSKRNYIGLRYIYGDKLTNQLEFGLCFEKFTQPYKLTSRGYCLRWIHNKVEYAIDYFPKHISDGKLLISSLSIPKDLDKTGIYFQLSIRGYLQYSQKY